MTDFRPMRRKRQQLSAEACAEILQRDTAGALALLGDEGYPYAVPLSYVYVEDGDGTGHLIFHSARSGHKIDAILREPKASFCVIDQDAIAPEEYTTYFRSVIAFGHMRVIDDETEKRTAIELLARRYAPEATPEREAEEIEKDWRILTMLEMQIEHLSGKEAIELVRARQE